MKERKPVRKCPPASQQELIAALHRGVRKAVMRLSSSQAKSLLVNTQLTNFLLATTDCLANLRVHKNSRVYLHGIIADKELRDTIYDRFGFRTLNGFWKIEARELRVVLREHLLRDEILAMHPSVARYRRRSKKKAAV
jgi:hypothetical protein